jgi:hypothetical protein
VIECLFRPGTQETFYSPSPDQEIARLREPTEELELFEFEGQLSIEEEEKMEDEDEGDWFSGPELLALIQIRGTSLHFAPRSASTGLPINITSNGCGAGWSDGLLPISLV